MHTQHFRRIQPALNQYRFYNLRLERDLFGAWTLTRHWGRIGRQSREMSAAFDSYHSARQAYRDQAHRRFRRGYRTK
jgi:predicted DNA-binding WGR domain protein